MKKLNTKAGFTLAELLIVVAIIAVLVAIAIPVFSAQLEKSREATDLANIRSEYAQMMVKIIQDPSTDISSGHVIALKQTVKGWATSDAVSTITNDLKMTIDSNGEPSTANNNIATLTYEKPADGSQEGTIKIAFSTGTASASGNSNSNDNGNGNDNSNDNGNGN